MKDEGKTLSLTAGLTTCFAFLRVHSWDLCDRAIHIAKDFHDSLSKPQRIVLKVTVTAWLAYRFVYSWTTYYPGLLDYEQDRSSFRSTLFWGLSFLASLLYLLRELIGKE